MRIKPILFNTEMVRAILDGRKTVTRRVINPRPMGRLCYIMAGSDHGKWGYSSEGAQEIWGDELKLPANLLAEEKAKLWTPPYHADDVLYVRETWLRMPDDMAVDGVEYVYRASCSPTSDEYRRSYGHQWRPSIHMPREAARLWLRVTNITVEHLHKRFFETPSAISELWTEGIDISVTCRNCISAYGCPCCIDEDAEGVSECNMLNAGRDDFAHLWDSTIKRADLMRYGWDANPWVWRIAFERCAKPEGFDG